MMKERVREEFEGILKEVNRIGKELPSLIGKLPVLPERDLEYRPGAFGITELLSCPLKAEIRRELKEQGIELHIESQEIEDGFLYENLVKLALANLYGTKFIPEQTLSYDFILDGELFKIDGHLDCFIEMEDRVIGIEVKHTSISYNNEITGRPPQFIFLSPDDRETVSINHRYYIQTQIQRYLLKKLFPDKKVETFLLMKTQLKTRWKMGKTTVVLPVEKDISEEDFFNICRLFREEKKPRAGWECYLCNYKDNGYCFGVERTSTIDVLEDQNDKKIEKLIFRRKSLKEEIKNIEEQLKKYISSEREWEGKKIGWIEKTSYSYDLPKLAKILKEHGIKAVDYFQIKWSKTKELEELLGQKIEEVRTSRKSKKFILP